MVGLISKFDGCSKAPHNGSSVLVVPGYEEVDLGLEVHRYQSQIQCLVLLLAQRYLRCY